MSLVGKPITCRAAVMFKEGEPLKIEDVIIDPPGEDQIRVRIVAAGICASDGHLVWGQQTVKEFNSFLPSVPGHEGSGVVESVGPNVTSFSPGDHVLAAFMPQCGNCAYCKNPHTNVCMKDDMFTMGTIANKKLLDGTPVSGFGGLGVYSEYLLIKASQAVKINKKANLTSACIISCAVATGFFSAVNQAKVHSGSTCAVWGLGAIGMNALFGCKHQKAANIIGIDLNNDKREMALKMGCTEFVNPKELDKPIQQYLLEKYGGADYAFDCFGSKLVLDQCLASLSAFGTVVSVGLPSIEVKVEYPVRELLFGRKIIGALMGLKKPQEAYTELAQMYVDGTYDIDLMITNRFRLEQINEAFQTLKDGKCVRSLILFDDKQ